MEAAITFSGTSLDNDGKPSFGTIVYFTSAEDNFQSYGLAFWDGEFDVFKLSKCAYNVRIERISETPELTPMYFNGGDISDPKSYTYYSYKKQPLDLTNYTGDPFVMNLKFFVPAMGSISGKITEVNGKTSISGAIVNVYSPDSTDPLLSERTNDGAFKIEKLEPGSNYNILVQKSGYMDAWYTPSGSVPLKKDAGKVTVTDGTDTSGINLNLRNADAKINGTVKSDTGKVMAGVTISASDSNGWSASTKTTNAGTYSLPIAAGTWTLTASYTGQLNSTKSITIGSKETKNANDFVMGPGRKISGKILLTSSTGLAGVSVSNGLTTTTTDGTGSFSFSALPPASYTITASKTGYAFTPATSTILIAAKDVALTMTAKKNSFIVSGKILSAGSPLKGVTLTVGTSYSATTGDDGSYTFTNLPAGNVTIKPAKDGYYFSPAAYTLSLTTVDVTNQNFTAGLFAEARPSALTPASGAVQTEGLTNVPLKWVFTNAVIKPLLTGYKIQVSTDNDFTVKIVDTTVTTTSYTAPLLPNTTYYWRVCSLFNSGVCSDWVVESFKTNKLKIMVAAAPKVVKNSNNITFSWTKPAGAPAAGYYFTIQYGTDPAFANSGLTTTIKNFTGLSTNVSLAISSPVKTYYWRIKMTNSAYTVDYTDWSAAAKFTR